MASGIVGALVYWQQAGLVRGMAALDRRRGSSWPAFMVYEVFEALAN